MERTYKQRLKKMTKELESFLKSKPLSYDGVRNKVIHGVYIVYKNNNHIYVGSSTKKGHKRLQDLTSHFSNHTLHKKLLEEELGIKKLPRSKKEIVKHLKISTFTLNNIDSKVKDKIEKFTFRIDSTFSEVGDIKNFEHFTIAVLEPPYND